MPARCRSSVRRLAASVEGARFVTRFASAKTAFSQICRRQGTGSSLASTTTTSAHSSEKGRRGCRLAVSRTPSDAR